MLILGINQKAPALPEQVLFCYVININE